MSYDLTLDDYWKRLGLDDPNEQDINYDHTTSLEYYSGNEPNWTENETMVDTTSITTQTPLSAVTADKIGKEEHFPDFFDDVSVKQEIPNNADWAKVIFTIILFLLGFLTYLFVLLGLGKRKKLKQDPVNWFMFNIGLCNILFLFTFPLFLIEDFVSNAEFLSLPVCLSREIIFFLNHFVTVVLLMVCCIVFLRRAAVQNWRLNAGTPLKITAVTWTTPVAISFIVALLTKFVFDGAVPVGLGAFSAGIFLLCSLVIGIGCILILRRSRQKTIVPSSVSSQIEDPSTDTKSKVQEKSNATQKKVAMLAIWTCICYTIFHVFHLLNEFGKKQDGLCGSYDGYIFFAAYVNVAINPFMFLIYDIHASKKENAKQSQDSG